MLDVLSSELFSAISTKISILLVDSKRRGRDLSMLSRLLYTLAI